MVLLVVLDDFLNDEVQEFLCEFRVQISPFRKTLQPRDLLFLARWVGWGKVVLRLKDAHGLCVFETLCQGKDKDRVQPVDAVAMLGQKFGGAGNGVSQLQSLSV